MSDAWDFYDLLVDNEPASIFVDIGIGINAPVKPYTQLAYLRIYMLNPRKDGRSSQEEFDELCRLENAVTGAITGDGISLYVGRNTSGGNRDLYFYTENGEQFEVLAGKAMAAFPPYSFVTGSRADPEWQTYFDFLYPSPMQMQQIKNRAVLEKLKENGDQLVAAREIAHFVYFMKIADCEAFSIYIRKLGFVAEPAHAVQESGQYGLTFYKVDRPNEIDGITTEIQRAVVAHRGEYDGWECQVIT